ncbi:Lhr family ATP-dependent helicase [Rathayibacter soli]|uniref:Lhr family ATP-dependent helicase n=1 Tax=Rathayibacter soli TaxID=3144168 RepID=UPI0027E47F52|nr:DEAD/DEAH box helicase [Glaciibacter superstes]
MARVSERFSPATRAWFDGAFTAPTEAQVGAWDAISRGSHTLVVAPTGSGKTLAAFLWAIDRLATTPPPLAGRETPTTTTPPLAGRVTPTADTPAGRVASRADTPAGRVARERSEQAYRDPRPPLPSAPTTRVLYISPLKALGVDVERNLRAPLVGITQTAKRLGADPPQVTVGVRSGDTPANERRALVKTPPDILITTPESLFLMLTSAARESLRGVETVIVDEIHAVAATKRGAHLAVSLERLDALLARPAQRIGLSATVRPPEEVARFLGGRATVTIVAPTSHKRFDLSVVVPLDDMSELGSASQDGASAAGAPQNGSIWPHVESAIVDRILEHTSTIVFANSRRLAERLTARLNEIYDERLSEARDEPSPGGRVASASYGGLVASASYGGRVASASERIETRIETRIDTPAGTGPETALLGKRPPAEMMGGSGQTRGLRAASAPTATLDALGGEPLPADRVLARAHHGSVSKEQRAGIEDDLKTGRLRCVVATSSLELGIDMGEVDLVIQVEAPPSVAGGLQRVGRAGHQVGEVSRGIVFPKHRADLIHCAVTSERMVAGLIEQLSVPTNPLDILAQQTVAACALEPIDIDEWFDTVRRSAPFAALPRSAYEATLDLLAGRYPSDEFAELRPRIVWDRDRGTLTGRPGAQRLAVTSGGTIPDRGLFGVYMMTGESNGSRPGSGSSTGGPSASSGDSRRVATGRRVGELDEEMVYESRVGDVFALGATSWRIQEITHDRVLVTPAFGEPGRLPFWKGDGIGRPAELGRAIGAFVRELSGASPTDATARCTDAGLDERATRNLLAYLAEQRAATAHIPTDRTLVAERFRDELGDWRLVLHSPYGMQVHAPWALAVGTRVRERFGIDGAVIASDDGIIVRIPDTESEPPSAELFVFEADELDALVTEEVGGSALFAARFRECAARALLLPKYNPGKRSPLWQQRQKASQLLDVARKFPTFPIILETVRECLQDVYDLPALTKLARRIASRDIRIVETATDSASPFARSLLFGYVASFMYEGDSPLAERRAAALSVDASLLAELLGRAELRELLDPAVIERVELELQRLAPDRRVHGVEGVADLLRLLGPLTAAEIAARLEPPAGRAARELSVPERKPKGEQAYRDPDTTPAAPGLDTVASAPYSTNESNPLGLDTVASAPYSTNESNPPGLDTVASAPYSTTDTADADALVNAKRALRVSFAGHDWYTAIEDAGRLRDALGVPLPIGVPIAFVEPVPDPLGDLIGRYARTHGPFTAAEAAARFGLGTAVVQDTLRRLEHDRRVTEGEFRPNATGTEWCDSDVLRRIRRLSLAALRHEVEPVDQHTFGRFLPAWQHVGGTLRGVDAVASVIEQLSGVRIPASAWESLVLPARVSDYSPAMLDELTATGEVIWSGSGSLPGNDGWVSLHLADAAPLTLPPPTDHETDELQRDVLTTLGTGGGFFFRQLADAVGSPGNDALADDALVTALWDLVWAGLVTNDTLAPLRILTGGAGAHKRPRTPPRSRLARGRGYARPLGQQRQAPPLASGRWSILPLAETDATVRAHATAETLLERYGVVTRGSVMAEGAPGGFALAYRVLSRFEESARARRGYFIEGLGAAQFATGGTVDRLRSFVRDETREPEYEAVTLAATDPANPYGAALAWPTIAGSGPNGTSDPATGHRPGRKAGALVTLVDGALVLYLERGGKTALTFGDGAGLDAAGRSIGALVRRGGVDKLNVETVNGASVLNTPLAEALARGGFTETPRGLRMRSRP